MYKDHTNFSLGKDLTGGKSHAVLEISGDTVHLSDSSYIRDADIMRDGMDLVLKNPQGDVTIKGYFASETAPTLVGPDGAQLTPDLVESFTKSSPEYAQNGTLDDVSPVGAVHEVHGKATVTHVDGSVNEITIGTKIYEGDIIETGDNTAVNIKFTDETTFAVSDNARLAVDEYVFDPVTNEGSTDFSVLKGIFVFTSGLIGREDPDDVTISTPTGSIGIRGTIIAGNADSGEITVVEGAIVLHDHHGNEVTLANQFETAKFDTAGGKIQHLGELTANDMGAKFSSVSSVTGELFSSIGDAAKDSVDTTAPQQQDVKPDAEKPAAEETKAKDQTDSKEPVQKTDQPHTEVKPEGKTEAPVEKSAQVLEQRLGDMELKLMNGHGSAQTNVVEMQSAKEVIADIKAALQTTPDIKLKAPVFEPIKPVEPINPIANKPPAPINLAPQLTHEAPDAYFKMAAGKNWVYDFSNEFKDPEGKPLTFFLDAATVSQFELMEGSGLSWNFNPNTGVLTLNNIPGPTAINPFKVYASDGVKTASSDHSFSVVSSSNLLTAGSSNGTWKEGASVHSINGTNNTIFLNNSGTDFTVNGANNKIYTGENSRTVKISTSATDTTVMGGSHGDRVEVENTRTTIHGLDGDDVIALKLPTLVGSLGDLKIDLDDGIISKSSYSHAYRNGTSLSDPNLTPGDAIELIGDASNRSIDFTNINTLRGIETIQARGGTNETVKLNYQTVFDMTAEHKTLLFQGNTGDQLDLDDNTGGWVDKGTTVTIGGDTYNVWEGTGTGGTVTVLVDTDVVTTIV